MRLPLPYLLGAALAVASACAAARGSPFDAADPLEQWRVDLETGILWHFTGSATPLDYVIQPDFLTLVGPVNIHRQVLGGDLVLRPRYSLMLEPIIQGPEHHYYAGSASGLLEWWDRARTRCLFFTSGGGLGWLDAKGYDIPGAQGQEFNFNWFIYSGARVALRTRWTGSLGLYFQHVSNGHLDKVDPGVNAIGPMVNAGWRF